MVYNFNLGIGWASSGVEYAQSYRANIFRRNGIEAKFIFTDMFSRDNIEHMTKNIGFLDSEVDWLYTYLSGIKISPVTYTLEMLLESVSREYQYSRDGKIGKLIFDGINNFYTIYFVNEDSELVHRVEIVSNGCLIRKDYFTYCRIFSEYYGPLDHQAHLYQRRFFKENGELAYEEIIDNDDVTYRMEDAIFDSKEELVGYAVAKMNLSSKDIVIIDRTTGIGQAILENVNDAKVGIIIHADHFSESSANENRILWNNYYEYAFANHKRIDFYVTATEAQKKLLIQQFEDCYGWTPEVYAIPVGSVDELRGQDGERVKHSFITASRLANEKHVDWLVRAVAKVHEKHSDVIFDIYGVGAEEDNLKNIISQLQASSYIRLMGQHNLKFVYSKYDAYLSASLSEGFGLTLLEAVGSGLPLVGFNVRYGNQTFIENEENGYLLEEETDITNNGRVELLAQAINKLVEKEDLSSFRQKSYEIASGFLTDKVEKKWVELIKAMNQ